MERLCRTMGIVNSIFKSSNLRTWYSVKLNSFRSHKEQSQVTWCLILCRRKSVYGYEKILGQQLRYWFLSVYSKCLFCRHTYFDHYLILTRWWFFSEKKYWIMISLLSLVWFWTNPIFSFKLYFSLLSLYQSIIIYIFVFVYINNVLYVFVMI